MADNAFLMQVGRGCEPSASTLGSEEETREWRGTENSGHSAHACTGKAAL